MAEEHDPTDVDPSPGDDDLETTDVGAGDVTGEATGDDASGSEAGSGTRDEPTEPRPDPAAVQAEWRKQMRIRNRTTIGQLRVSFPERDVLFVMDGDAGLRTVAAFASPNAQQRWADPLDPDVCDAKWSVWTALDLASALAVTWLPIDSSSDARPSRFVVDPPAA